METQHLLLSLDLTFFSSSKKCHPYHPPAVDAPIKDTVRTTLRKQVPKNGGTAEACHFLLLFFKILHLRLNRPYVVHLCRHAVTIPSGISDNTFRRNSGRLLPLKVIDEEITKFENENILMFSSNSLLCSYLNQIPCLSF